MVVYVGGLVFVGVWRCVGVSWSVGELWVLVCVGGFVLGVLE